MTLKKYEFVCMDMIIRRATGAFDTPGVLVPGLPQRPLVYTPVAAPAEEVAKLKVSNIVNHLLRREYDD